MESNIAPQRSYRSVAQFAVVAVTATILSACIQTTATPDRTASRTFVRQAAPQQSATVTPRKQRTRVAARSQSTTAADGMASFYREGSRTASGEKFNPNELTAAHRTLPFGTKVRVTDVSTGKSVTVRVNDRGPFVGGRVIDVSHAAAESLGMTGKGVAKVKLDVVQ
jgi:rare lipoprotein A